MIRGTNPSQDNRAHWRLQTFVTCHVHLGENTFSGLLHDISSRGVFVSSQCSPPKGSSITISVETPESGEIVRLEGQVVRIAAGMTELGEVSRFGVRLNRISAGSLQLLKSLMAKQSDSIEKE